MLSLAVLLGLGATDASAADLPQIGPALVGAGPRSLVNLIDTAGLYAKGQRDAWVMFNTLILPDGAVSDIVGYRVSTEADLLKKEISKRLRDARFLPAVYNHRPTYAGASCSVVYAVINGKPHLRIFQNQDMDEIKRGTDLIWPQAINIPGAPANVAPYPGHADLLGVTGTVKIRQTVNADGKTIDVQAIGESPPGHGFAEHAVHTIQALHYLPAYRNGRPTACTRVFDYRFVQPGS